MSVVNSTISKLRALNVTYSNITSGLVSTNVQSAIDELSAATVAQFSPYYINSILTIPLYKQLIVSDGLEIGPIGSLSIEGKLCLI